jgi:hypothetical protein
MSIVSSHIMGIFEQRNCPSRLVICTRLRTGETPHQAGCNTQADGLYSRSWLGTQLFALMDFVAGTYGQGYAAATAAAYAKELLEVIQPTEVGYLPPSMSRSRQTESTLENVRVGSCQGETGR